MMTYEELIHEVGSPLKVAELCNSPDRNREGKGLTVHAVYLWKKHGIPAARLQFLEQHIAQQRKLREIERLIAAPDTHEPVGTSTRPQTLHCTSPP